MTAEQKQRAAELLAAWRATAYALHADRMADLLQELVDAPEPEPVARVTGYYGGYLSIATIDGRVLPAGTALYLAPPAPSVPGGWRPFLTDVITAAGLLEHGKRDKGLASRVGKFAFDAMRAAQAEPESHPDDIAVDKFAAAMKAKMAKSRAVGRYGWNDPAVCAAADLRLFLVNHIEKGDPVDVGNFAMMLFNRHETTAQPHPEPPDDVARDAALYCAAQRACAELPEGWEIRIELERSAGIVILVNPDGEDVDYSSDHEYMASDINAAIDFAIDRQGGES